LRHQREVLSLRLHYFRLPNASATTVDAYLIGQLRAEMRAVEDRQCASNA